MAANTYSLRFDGTKVGILDTTEVMTVRNLSAFTIMAWVKIGSGSTDPKQRLYVERQGSSSKIRLAITPLRDMIRFEFGPKDGTDDINYDYRAPTGVSFDNDLWTHIAFAVSISSNVYHIIVNGQDVATGELTLPADTEAVSDTSMAGLGCYLGNYLLSPMVVYSLSRGWQGSVDELMLFDNALSASAIQTYIEDGEHWDTADENLISYWKFDTGTYASQSSSTTDAKASKTGTLYQVSGGGTTSTITNSFPMWQYDRPFLGDGLDDVVAPSAPTLVSGGVTMTADDAVVTWTGSRDGSASLDVASNSIGYVQNFEAQVATTNDFSALVNSVLTQANTITFTNLVGNTTHYFRVRAIDAAGNEGAWSATVSKDTLVDVDLIPPSVPVGLNATAVTHNSFTLNWTPVVAGDLEGYYIDIARDPAFTSYLFNYQGASTANAFISVLGATPLTTYYARVYSYDDSGNVSNPSETFAVQTTMPPDVAPPTDVLVDEVTSIGSTAATLNWDPSRDDTAVTYYSVDVNTEDDFTGTAFYDDFNVGNVLSYRVTGLEPGVTFYYRVRAVDTVGNESNNPNEAYSFTTAVSTIDDIGVYETQVLVSDDSYTNSSSAGTNYNNDSLLLISGTNIGAWLKFDLNEYSGDVISATLNINVIDVSPDTISVLVDEADFDETTLTYTNRPTLTGTPKTFVANTLGWHSIDVTEYITGPGTYVANIYKSAAGSSDLQITNNAEEDSQEWAYLNLEINPTSATQSEELFVDTETFTLTNLATNPEFLVNTTGWSTAGSGTVAITRTADATSWFGGFTGSMNFSINPTNAYIWHTTPVMAVQGDTVSFSFAAKYTSGLTTFRFVVEEYLNTTQQVQTTYTTVLPSNTEWHVYTIVYTVTDADTDRVFLKFRNNAESGNQVYRITGFTAVKNAGSPVAPFTGFTDGAEWTGTAGASTSTIEVASLAVVGSYLGDSNDNNSSTLEVGPLGGDIVSTPSVIAIDTTNRFHEHTLAGWWVGNYLINPSFESGTTGWSLSGSTITSVEENPVYGDSSLEITIAAASTWERGVISRRYVASVGQVWRGSAWVMAPVGVYVYVRLVARNSVATLLGESTIGFDGSIVIGNGLYQQIISNPLTMPANTGQVEMEILTWADVGEPNYPDELIVSVDAATLQKGETIGQYVDGDFGGRWIGVPHLSPTARLILPETTYTLRQVYTDVDGIFDNQGDDSSTVSIEHTVAPAPDNAITVSDINFIATQTSLELSAPYVGDDDENAEAYFVHRRADKTAWIRAATTVNTTEKTINATIENLTPGTRYVIRLYVADTEVFGATEDNGEYYIETEETITEFSSPVGATDITIMYGGFVLTGAGEDGVTVTDHNAFGLPDRRIQVQDLARQHGSLLVSDLWGEKTIDISGLVFGDSREELQGNLDSLKGALALQGLQTLIIDTLSPRRTFYNAICESFDAPENAQEGFTYLRWDATFRCPDPFAYEQRTTTSELSVSNASPDITLFNGGNILTPLAFEITTDFSRPVYVTITNSTSGELVRPYEPVSAGDVITIDSDKRLVTKNGVDLSYAGGFINLVPGNNSLTVTLFSVGNDPTINYTASWNNRYI